MSPDPFVGLGVFGKQGPKAFRLTDPNHVGPNELVNAHLADQGRSPSLSLPSALFRAILDRGAFGVRAELPAPFPWSWDPTRHGPAPFGPPVVTGATPPGPPTTYNGGTAGPGFASMQPIMAEDTRADDYPSWSALERDVEFLDFMPQPPGDPSTFLPSALAGGVPSRDWDLYFHQLAAFEEACNALLAKGHFLNRWDVLDVLYPAVWERLSMAVVGSPFEPPGIVVDSIGVAPWPGYPPGIAAARARAMSWQSEPDLLLSLEQLEDKRAELGLATPTWSGYFVPYVSFPWRYQDGSIVMADLGGDAPLWSHVGVPKPDGTTGFLIKAAVSTAFAVATGLGAAAVAGAAFGTGIAGTILTPVAVESLTSGTTSGLMGGDVGAGLVGGALEGLGQGLLDGVDQGGLFAFEFQGADELQAILSQPFFGSSSLGSFLSSGLLSAAESFQAGGDVEEGFLIGVAEEGTVGFSDLLGSISKGFEDAVEDVQGAVGTGLGLVGSLGLLDQSISDLGDDGFIGSPASPAFTSPAVAPPSDLVGQPTDPSTGFAFFQPSGIFSNGMPILILGGLALVAFAVFAARR